MQPLTILQMAQSYASEGFAGEPAAVLSALGIGQAQPAQAQPTPAVAQAQVTQAQSLPTTAPLAVTKPAQQVQIKLPTNQNAIPVVTVTSAAIPPTTNYMLWGAVAIGAYFMLKKG
jgi:hypothetical protein